jgi:ComF family protein
VLAPFLYASPIDRFILELKFRARLDRARLLGELLGDYLSRHGRAFPECVIPVPLHRRRLRERGYNQALELARPVSRMLDIPLQYHEAVRIRATAAQSDLDLAGRKRNVHGAFALAQPLKAKHVAIMDDVITTGHTANELARCLRRGGVQTVEVWALARA